MASNDQNQREVHKEASRGSAHKRESLRHQGHVEEEALELNKETAKLLEDLRLDLDHRMDFLKKSNLSDLHRNKEELESLKVEVLRARKVLTGTDKYLRDDFLPAVARLRETLAKHSSHLHEKLKHESVEYNSQEHKPKNELELLRETSADQEKMTHIAAEMKELEKLSIRMTSQVERLSAAIKEEEEREKKRRKEEQRREEEEKQRHLQDKEETRRQEEAMERKRREEEARRIRHEEEERVRRIEEERLKKEDPRNWANVITFETDPWSDALGAGVAIVLRAPEAVSVVKTQMLCSLADPVTTRYPLAEYEELSSNMVTLKPTAGRDIEFESSVWLAIPYASSPRTRETIIKFRRVFRRPMTPPEKADDEKEDEDEDEGRKGSKKTHEEEAEEEDKPPVWEDAMTRDTTVEGYEHFRFVETYLRHLPAEGFNILVLTRFKRDHQTFNSKGGKLVSSVDHRVSVAVPKNGFRLTTDMSMQTIPLDTSAMAGLKERFEGCEDLLGTSPMVRLSSSNKPNKPLTYYVAHPTGGNKTKRIGTSKRTGSGNEVGSGAKEMTLPRTSNSPFARSGQDENAEVDYVTLLTKEGHSRSWRTREDVVIESQKDTVSFQLPNVVDRFLLLRTNSRKEGSELAKIAANLETSLREKPTVIIARQSYEEPTNILIECCKRDNAERTIQRLKEEKFSEGPVPPIVCLREGDVIEVCFNPMGNIDFADRTPRRMIFFSNLAMCKLFAEVKEVDIFAQNALDHFRGNVRFTLLERTYQTPSKFESIPRKDDTKSGLLCELMVYLPKPRKELTQVKKIRLPITPDGPLSEEYFNQLSSDLGDEWFQVASYLKISKASIQRITASNAHIDGVEATQRSIKDMLREWFLSSTKSTDKSDDLRVALLTAGRNDLAEELANKSRELRQEVEKRQEEVNLRKCIQAYCASQAAVRAWRTVAKALGLREEDVRKIAGEQKEATMAQGMLRRWKEIKGRDATKESLIIALKKLKLNEAAGKVSLIR